MTGHDQVVLASGNPGKLKELQQTLAPAGVRLRPQSEFLVSEVDETGLTFVENALLKARAASQQSALPAIADDSGIEVDALRGEPGIHSARFAAKAGAGEGDEANNQLLLERMQGLIGDQRSARFQCVLVFLRFWNDPTPLICQGSWEGQIAEDLCGAKGFGYDPLFWLPERGLTSAELAPTEKNRISHRAIASQALLQALLDR